MRIDLPDDADPANVISIEEVRGEYERRRLGQTCEHRRIAVSAAEIVVTCRDCGERLATNAWLLDHRVEVWARVNAMYGRVHEERKKLEKRQRIRCQHCNRLTGTTRDERFEIVREARKSETETTR